ncbi:DUF5988 family protein [Streptomyces sp. ISL-11]|uniref:DUF5988 family protein n=1 Tax=Streptomyces sp. ISL-11 TaxID=2819174 RepID=UPI001BEBDDCF|nr:DUF5988 family protein [Streptomyces sp. ISL-11]MBT2384970.1 hypothetical protein [Streptomyces sp. ISL-11]
MCQLPNALLVEGPDEIPAAERLRRLDPPGDKVTLTWYGGREHFVATGETTEHDGHCLAVYRWAYRTRIAE